MISKLNAMHNINRKIPVRTVFSSLSNILFGQDNAINGRENHKEEFFLFEIEVEVLSIIYMTDCKTDFEQNIIKVVHRMYSRNSMTELHKIIFGLYSYLMPTFSLKEPSWTWSLLDERWQIYPANAAISIRLTSHVNFR